MVLEGVQALTFDVFGTVVDWHGSVVRSLKQYAAKSDSQNIKELTDEDWSDFAKEWRKGYYTKTCDLIFRLLLRGMLVNSENPNSRERAEGAEGSLNVDVVHREILDEILANERWAALNVAWGDSDLAEINTVWHRLDGWPDSSKGLAELKKKFIISTLTNGNTRLMVDMAKHANLPWDVILNAELLGSFKPNPIVYRGALHYLSVKPEQCAMVAAHIHDLRSAAKEGMRTIYIRRPTEDTSERKDSIKAKTDGGEVDVAVDSFEELAELLGCNSA